MDGEEHPERDELSEEDLESAVHGSQGDHDGSHEQGELPEDEEDEETELPDAEEGEEDDDDEIGESVTVEITGLSLYTHHGVSEAEREVGQRLMLDLRLDLGEADATATDRIEDTVDYAEVCQLVALIAQQRSHKTLERLCGTIADRLLADYELDGVSGEGDQARAPDRALGRGSLGRGLARST